MEVLFRWIVGITCALGALNAHACPEGQYESCVLGACVCLPKVGGDVGREAERIKNETIGQSGGALLEQWIIQSYNSAIGSSQPIPPQIRQALTGYVEQDLLNRARFKVDDNGILNLAGLSIAYGDKIFGREVQAITLINLIVFRNANDAFNNPGLWAHELMHVKQFRDWGTRDFSIRYARNSDGVEEPAYDFGNRFPQWQASQGGPGPFGRGAGGLAPGTMMQGCGCWGSPSAAAPEEGLQNPRPVARLTGEALPDEGRSRP